MKFAGIALVLIGLIWGVVAFNMKTDVAVDSSGLIALGVSPSLLPRSVQNVGLMEERRNHLFAAGMLMIGGFVLFGFGVNSEARARAEGTDSEPKGALATSGTKKCPACAEDIKIEALKCKHCGQSFDEVAVKQQIKEMEQQKELKLQAIKRECKKLDGVFHDDAYCSACKCTSPMNGMYYHSKTGKYYHEECLLMIDA